MELKKLLIVLERFDLLMPPRLCYESKSSKIHKKFTKKGFQITYRYIDPSRHNFKNCFPPQFISQSCLGQPLAVWSAKGVLRDKSWKETIFKISAQQFNVQFILIVWKLIVWKKSLVWKIFQLTKQSST